MGRGLVIALVGMGGTLLALWFITLIIEWLKKIFPYREGEETNNNGKERS